MYLVLLVIVQHQTFQGILLVLLFGFWNFNHLMLRDNPYAQDSNICCSESLKPHISYVVCIIHGNGLMCISNSSISWSVITVMIFAILFFNSRVSLKSPCMQPTFFNLWKGFNFKVLRTHYGHETYVNVKLQCETVCVENFKVFWVPHNKKKKVLFW